MHSKTRIHSAVTGQVLWARSRQRRRSTTLDKCSRNLSLAASSWRGLEAVINITVRCDELGRKEAA